MSGEVLVALLVTGILGDVVEVLSSDDEGSVHLGGNDGAGQDTATDGDETGEGALLVWKVNMLATISTHRAFLDFAFVLLRVHVALVSLAAVRFAHRVPSQLVSKSHLQHVARTDVGALNGGLGGSETKTDVLVPSAATLARSGALGSGLRVLEDVRLLLESALGLNGQLGRPDGKLATGVSKYR